MTDAPATPAPAVPEAPKPAAVPKTGHRITDPGDASPIGRADESDFVPKPQVTTALPIVLPGMSAPR